MKYKVFAETKTYFDDTIEFTEFLYIFSKLVKDLGEKSTEATVAHAVQKGLNAKAQFNQMMAANAKANQQRAFIQRQAALARQRRR